MAMPRDKPAINRLLNTGSQANPITGMRYRGPSRFDVHERGKPHRGKTTEFLIKARRRDYKYKAPEPPYEITITFRGISPFTDGRKLLEVIAEMVDYALPDCVEIVECQQLLE